MTHRTHHGIRRALIATSIPALTLSLVFTRPERPAADAGGDQSGVSFALTDVASETLHGGAHDKKKPCVRRKSERRSEFDKRCRAYPSSAGVAPPDFNADGVIEVVVGVPEEDLPGRVNVGVVNILFRSGFGFNAETISQELPSVQDTAEAQDRFGAAIAPGHFNGDAFTDLAVAVPGEGLTFEGNPVSGALHVFHSTIASTAPGANVIAILADNDQLINPGDLQTPNGIIPVIGDSLVWGDFDGDGFGDLAVEVRNLGNAAVIVLFGGIAVPGVRLDGLDPNIRETRIFPSLSQTDVVLAAGDFNGDDVHDLVIGSPNETVGGALRAGRIAIVSGVAGNRSTTLTSVTTRNGTTANNRFGASLAAGDFNGSGQDDLAVGEPGADIAGLADAGRVRVLLGSDPDGILPNAPFQNLSQSFNVAGDGDPEPNDGYGEALAAADLNFDGFEDLAVGVPFEDVALSSGSVMADAGAVNVYFGSGASLTFEGAHLWSQATVRNGVPVAGGAERSDRFGTAVSAWKGQLNIGVPLEDVDVSGTNVSNAGAVNMIFNLSTSGNLLKVQDEAVAASDRFGSVIY